MGYTGGMLTFAVDAFAAYFIAKTFRRWFVWLPLALLAGALSSMFVGLVMGLSGVVSGADAFRGVLSGFLLHAIFCALVTWGAKAWAARAA